ncbi:MAG: hypothetical protein IPO64_13775 [Bacteroidetes bacterium]|nr:hypothetical protein [Bacteroidota bacterium]
MVEIDNGSCTGRDSIDIIISTSGLSLNLGNDTSLCAGQTLTLTQNIAGVSYTWSDGTTNNSITVNTSGTYWLEIDNGSCTGRDSIDIIISTSGRKSGESWTHMQGVIHGVMAPIIALR